MKWLKIGKERFKHDWKRLKFVGLTLTWDVLKCFLSRVFSVRRQRLTLTWDVLKWWWYSSSYISVERLTLTWDVLKYFSVADTEIGAMININMRCIEIIVKMALYMCKDRLTLTWDVLK